MNDIAGGAGITLADVQTDGDVEEFDEAIGPSLHQSNDEEANVSTAEEDAVCDMELEEFPELTDQYHDDSDSESDEEEPEELLVGQDNECGEIEDQAELGELLEELGMSAHKPEEQQPRILRRSSRETAGKQRYDTAYDWNLMNLSVSAAMKNFGDVAKQACMAELLQLFREKRALTPVRKEDLTEEQRKSIIRSHMFLAEKYEDGKFIKMKGRVVADGRMQDRTVYTNYSAPTAKTRSVITCLKLAAVKGWDLLKLDVGGAFLCAPIGEDEEVFMSLDRELASKAVECMPEVKPFLGEDGKLIVRVDKAMYGLIQSARLWYNELTRYLCSKGFKKCEADDCILVKQMLNGQYLIAVLYVDDILVMGKVQEDRHWVRSILQAEYEKITVGEGPRMTYLGMTIIKKEHGFEISMRSYVEDILKLYNKPIKTCVTPAKLGLFEVAEESAMVDHVLFHSVVAKLLYLGKRGRPDILLPVQFLCTRVKKPTVADQRKLERVLGYLLLTKTWARTLDNSSFTQVTTYIDASFAQHVDGKSQSGCMIFWATL
jgi:hypothetical protein